MNLINLLLKFRIGILLLCLFLLQNTLSACDQSNLTLISYTIDAGFHRYSVRLCIGGGITGLSKGADYGTSHFGLALYKDGATINVTNYTPSLTSTETGVTNPASLQGPQPQSPFFCEEFLYYQQQTATPFICVTSTAQCGLLHSDCFNINFTTDVPLDSILAFGVEGNGNPVVGCYQESDMLLTFGVLPVELNSFEGIVTNNQVTLNWQTFSEINNDYFEIERSIDDRYFTSIGQVAGKGNSSERSEYVYIDSKVETGTYYYRLKQVDFDGSIHYSAVIAVTVETPQITYNLFPNPTTGIVNIQNIEYPTNTQIAIYNHLGQQVRWYEQVKESLNLNDLETGIYFIIIHTNNQTHRERLVKM